MAQKQFDRLEFLQEKDKIQIALKEVSEFREIVELDDPFPMQQIWDSRKDLEIASVEGNYLNCEALVRIVQNLNTSSRVRAYIQKRQEKYPLLWRHTGIIIDYKALVKEINAKIDFVSYEVKDNASVKLNQIRKNISRSEQNARRAVNRLFKSYSQKGFLQDEHITLKDGRLVLPVKWEHKGKVNGLVHDHSASGATLFIEPYEAVEINNEIGSLRREESLEVERILILLTSLIHNELEGIIQNLSILVQMDFIQAKARFSKLLNSALPALNDENIIISKGKHPLLLLRKEGREKVVPLDLEIGESIKTLVITGPNAGGKTVTLKTVGLFSLMVQSGIPIPCSPDSQMPIFENIFADIGDFQSIEQDLSTFSSRMKRFHNILERANHKSLVLVDEIGVGTDPEEGSALAVAFLEELTRRKCTTIVTTHLSALKEFAFSAHGVENGSMEFEIETLQPAYKFRMGIPGSSYAIEIAKRLGISANVLSRSKELVGVEKGKLEHLILELENKVQESQKLKEDLKLEKIRLQGLTNLYSERFNALKSAEKSMKEKALQEAQMILMQSNATVEKAIKEIRENQAERQSISRAKQLIAEEKAKITKDINNQKHEKPEKVNLPASKVQIGDEVFWKNQNAYGKIISSPDGSGKVMIQFDNFKFKVPLKEIFAGKKKQSKTKHATTVKVPTTAKSDILPEIDVRGQTLDEAIEKTDKFLDDALLAGWNQVRIIHGKGTGVLRKGIDDYLNQHPRVKNKKIGAWNEGDIGVTVVELD